MNFSGWVKPACRSLFIHVPQGHFFLFKIGQFLSVVLFRCSLSSKLISHCADDSLKISIFLVRAG
jgi:hypothetical protein